MQRTYQLASVSGVTVQHGRDGRRARGAVVLGPMRRLRTVLVVDDELDVREIVGEVLADAGYDVRLAADGRQGLAEVSGAPRPLVLLLDLVMPVMTGASSSRSSAARRRPQTSRS